MPVSSSGSDPAPPSVIGLSSVAYIDENHISVYAATEVDYETAAYCDSYVESCLYQDGSAIACANQTSAPGASAAGGYLNTAISAGHHYQFQTNHYLVAPFAYVSAGVNYYYNPFGYGFAPDGGDYSIDDADYWSGGVAVYVAYADIFLGPTGLDAYTPLTIVNRGDLKEAVAGVTANSNGTYNITFTGAGWDVALSNGFESIADVEAWPTCPFPSLPCAVYNGAKVLVVVGGAAAGAGAIIWNI